MRLGESFRMSDTSECSLVVVAVFFFFSLSKARKSQVKTDVLICRQFYIYMSFFVPLLHSLDCVFLFFLYFGTILVFSFVSVYVVVSDLLCLSFFFFCVCVCLWVFLFLHFSSFSFFRCTCRPHSLLPSKLLLMMAFFFLCVLISEFFFAQFHTHTHTHARLFFLFSLVFFRLLVLVGRLSPSKPGIFFCPFFFSVFKREKKKGEKSKRETIAVVQQSCCPTFFFFFTLFSQSRLTFLLVLLSLFVSWHQRPH